ncbi:hypothetical protein VTG60DRAFT_4889 [Thermothelomyces hinnuleus]
MVYCGKPSKGCQMCRTRRIKCDETKPTCNQCAKARRECPGYKDEFDLVLRNENLAAKRRALKLGTSRRGGSARNAGKKAKASADPTSSSSSSPSSSCLSSALKDSTSLSSATTNNTLTAGGFPSLSVKPYRREEQQQQQQQQQQQCYYYQQTLSSPSPTPIHLAPESLAPCHFVANFVLLPRQDGTRGFLEYILPLLEQTSANRDSMAHLRHAFDACALASLGNRLPTSSAISPSNGPKTGWSPSLPGRPGPGGAVVDGRQQRTTVLAKAFAEYSKALRATQAALVDPVRWRNDDVLAAVLLLGMFETITATQLDNLAWGSHVEGAIQLVKARGRSQLKTKIGLQLFIAVRTQLVIHSLSTGNAPAMGAEWWLEDAVIDPTAAECQRLSLKVGELRAEVIRLMSSVTRTQENIGRVQDLMRRAQDLDQQAAAWMKSVPEAWQPRTLCWQLQSLAVPSGSDYSKAEVFPGRIDAYRDFWVASVWNQVRTTRLILMSIIVRCAAWVCSPLDYRTTPEYATAARVCVDTISDILASVPYHLGWHTKRRDLVPEDDPACFGCGDEQGIKGLAGYFLSWPLACVLTQDYTTDAQRAYIKGRLKHIGDELGIKYAHILSSLNVRVPSLLIRSDGFLAQPYPMAHNFGKLISSARKPYPAPKGCTQNQQLHQEGRELAQPVQVQGGSAGASGAGRYR